MSGVFPMISMDIITVLPRMGFVSLIVFFLLAIIVNKFPMVSIDWLDLGEASQVAIVESDQISFTPTADRRYARLYRVVFKCSAKKK